LIDRILAIVVILAVSAGAAAAANPPDSNEPGVRYSITEWQSISWTQDKPLWVNEIDGGIFVRPNSEKDIKIKAIRTAFAPDIDTARHAADGFKMKIDEPSDRIEVKTERPEPPETGIHGKIDYDIRVSGEVPLRIETVSGQIDVNRIDGPVNAYSASGSIILSGIKGPVTAKSVSGDIEIHNCSETLQVITSAGKITFEADSLTAGEITLETKSGNIEIEINEEIGATFEIHTITGTIDTADSKLVSVSENNGVSTYKCGNGKIAIKISSVAGNITIKRTEFKEHFKPPMR
jgi:DUF4097 and DUF4098 domain-containing protein YvlB